MPKANSISIPTGFNAASKASVQAVLALIPTNGVDTWEDAQDDLVIIPPFLEAEIESIFSGGFVFYSDVPYALMQPAESSELFTGVFVDEPILIPLFDITYSQSSVYFDNTAATAESMIDGQIGGSATGTDFDSPAWIKMDLGAEYDIDRIVIGTATTSMPGGWDKSYTENASIQSSNNGLDWTTLTNTQTFNAEGIFVFNVVITARYIRLFIQSGYLAVTEFYPLAPQQPLFSSES
jgi:hypothetical protein